MARLLAACLLVLGCSFLFAQEGPLPTPPQAALSNDAIIKMTTAGLNDDLILQTIHTQPGHYSTSADDLIALKKAGVSDRVVAAMIGQSSAPIAASAAIAPVKEILPPGVDDVGVYWKNKNGDWVRMTPEIVNYKSSSVIPSLVTRNIVKQDMNGNIEGPAAQLKITNPVDILLYMPEGTEPEEYLLLKLRVNSKSREFRSSTGGVFHSTTGAQRDEVDFAPIRIGPRLYEFTVTNAKAGEYGVLPPGAVRSANAASGGKIYTFHVIE